MSHAPAIPPPASDEPKPPLVPPQVPKPQVGPLI